MDCMSLDQISESTFARSPQRGRGVNPSYGGAGLELWNIHIFLFVIYAGYGHKAKQELDTEIERERDRETER